MIRLLGKCGRGMGLLALFSAVVAALQFVVPLYMMTIYNRILQTGSLETLQAVSLIAAGLLLVLGIAETARSRILAMMAKRISAYLKSDVYQAVVSGPASVLANALQTTEIGERSETAARSQAVLDLRTVSDFVASGAINTFFDAVLAPVFLLALFLLHPFLGWIGLGAAVFILSLAILAEVIARDSNAQINKAEGRAQARIERLMGQFDAVAGMGIAPNLYQRWDADRDEADALSLRSQSIVGAIGGLARAARMVVQIAVLGVGAWLVLTSEGFLAGAIIASSIIMTRALAPIDQSISVWQRFVRARASAANLMRIVDAVNALPERPATMIGESPSLRLDKVTLVFPGQRNAMLQDATLRIAAGETLGVLGPVGAGKTTLLRTMAGLHRPRSGSVLLGDTPVDLFAESARQTSFGYLPQDIQLLPGTILENISRFAPDGAETRARVQTALSMVGALGFVEALPEGMGTQWRPERLSAGQTQLLGLARAFYGDPALALLDEPTANLDAEGKATVARAIAARAEAGLITVFVSHDRDLLATAPRLLYIASGVAKLGATQDVFAYLAERQRQAAEAIAASPPPNRGTAA